MAKNIYGDVSQTNANELNFEQETDLKDILLKISGYNSRKQSIF